MVAGRKWELTMSKLFKKLPDAEKKMVRLEILLSKREAEDIRAFALIRNLSNSEFVRRASLGRRADVGLEVEIILCLREVVQSIRLLHANYVAQGVPIPKAELEKLMDHALGSMLKIGRKQSV